MLVAVIIAIVWIISTLAADPKTPPADDSSTTPSASSTPTQSEEPDEPKAVKIDEDDYIGRNVDDVRRELQRKGLEVDPTVQDNDGSHEPDTVSGLDPTRNLYEGDTVTIRYYGERPVVEPPPTREEPDEEESDDEDSSDGESPDGWVIPDLPGNGNGNGGGND
jgi:eukaryotic-like serine/threonine-protein kinase